MRIDWKDKRDIPGKIMTVEQFAKIVKYFRHIHFCGQISDPIFNPNFITFLYMCKRKIKGHLLARLHHTVLCLGMKER